jgi:ribosomal protein S11
MPRTAAKLTQADIRRVIRAAKLEKATGIRVLPDGSLHVDLIEDVQPEKTDNTKRPRL